jgi:hypothetical protein
VFGYQNGGLTNGILRSTKKAPQNINRTLTFDPCPHRLVLAAVDQVLLTSSDYGGQNLHWLGETGGDGTDDLLLPDFLAYWPHV